MVTKKNQMNIVILGHVDHGKSTVVGRLLADTGSLPEGKLASIREYCEKNSRPFEYSFLLDALKDEKKQGITIDTARCFFETNLREYIIIDAPGHIEFLKNMITGAARAEAALLIIDAAEGVQENSRRHGYMASMLGIDQLVVCVNKMDLVQYDKETFDKICSEYRLFLEKINLNVSSFIPISAREGDNITELSKRLPWYQDLSVLEVLDHFEKEKSLESQSLRFPVQDIYKFTNEGDQRRIIAGKLETGTLKVGDSVIFLPSGKKSKISTIEEFNKETQNSVTAGCSIGITLKEQIYIQPGDMMVHQDQKQCRVASRLKAHIFWLGKEPFVKHKKYKLKLASSRMPMWLEEVHNVLDASDLTSVKGKQQVDRHDVAECTLECFKPIAFDLTKEIGITGRFVIVDNYEIRGGGIITEALENKDNLLSEALQLRKSGWEKTLIPYEKRILRYRQTPFVVLISGSPKNKKKYLAQQLEKILFQKGFFSYYLGISNSLLSVAEYSHHDRSSYLYRLGDVIHWFIEAGLIVITSISDLDSFELNILKKLSSESDFFVVNVGLSALSEDEIDVHLDSVDNIDNMALHLEQYLRKKKVLLRDDYSI